MKSLRQKSGFNIDDILQQQQKPCETSTNLLLEQNLLMEKPKENLHERPGSSGNSISSNSIIQATTSPEPNSSYSYDNIYNQTLPFYNQVMNLQKSSYCLPFSLGIPPVSYFEQYGNIFDKGYPHLSSFYHPYPPYYLPTFGSKRKGGQIRFTPQQTRSLENRFVNAKYLSPEDRRHLAIQLKLSDRQVKTWFQNRRAKWRRSNNITNESDQICEQSGKTYEDSTKIPSSTTNPVKPKRNLMLEYPQVTNRRNSSDTESSDEELDISDSKNNSPKFKNQNNNFLKQCG